MGNTHNAPEQTGDSPGQRLSIHIGVVAYNLTKELLELLQSCVSKRGHEVIVHLLDHSPHKAVNALCEKAGRGEVIGRDGRPVKVCLTSYRYNRGLCPGWNDGMLAAYGDKADGWGDDTNRVCILVNDDVVFDRSPEPFDKAAFFNPDTDGPARLGWAGDGKTDVDRLAEYAYSRRDLFMVTVLGFNQYYVDNPSPHPQIPNTLAGPWIGIGFSCFAVNPIALRSVGMCDENIVPIYFEDCDWGHRAIASGLQMGELKQTRILHYGSLSWRVDPALEEQNRLRATPAIREYFIKKWGCLPGGGEFYKTPFNQDYLTMFISPEKRKAPYGPLFDRYDIRKVVTL